MLDADGNELVEGLDFSVKYYNADGEEVGEIVNAGSYTLEVTSDYTSFPAPPRWASPSASSTCPT